MPGGHGNEAAAAVHGTNWTLIAARAGAFLAGCIVGWLVAAPLNRVLGAVFRGFNAAFDRATAAYGRIVTVLLRVSALVFLIYAGLMVLTYAGFATVPVGFIPEQDKGYLIVNAQLPDGASNERAETVRMRLNEVASKTPGVAHTISLAGYSILASTNIPNVAGMFVILEPFADRKGDAARRATAVAASLRASYREIQEAQVVVFGAPPIDGLGNTGGFKLQTQDRADAGLASLQGAVENFIAAGNAQPGLTGLFTSFSANQPQLFVDLNRTQAKTLGVALSDIFDTLQIYLGSAYVNDFTRFGRNWQVTAQAESRFRMEPEDIGRLQVRNKAGEMVPLRAVLSVSEVSGPAIVNHYNMYPSAEINGNTSPGTSSGQAIGLMETIGRKELPGTMSFEWTELTLQQILAGNTAVFVFILGAVFVFLTLAAQYESWSLPLAIILIVPMCLLAAIAGVFLTGLVNDIFTQVGLVVLIGLASKNAILIVEFAKQLEDQGKPRQEATIEASKLRLRPILMTSLAFTLGVVPLILSKGAGSEMRLSLGVAVFSGMLGVTAFGIFFTPVFYSVVRKLAGGRASPAPQPARKVEPQPAAASPVPVLALSDKESS